jgi:hypothetical protein
MTKHVAGEFEVKMIPQAPPDPNDAPIGRMLLDKRYLGPLEAVSKGEMLAAMTGVKGSAGYVAMERVSGTLDGRNGTFVLQHSGTMNRGAATLSVTVVPDSGTGELTGLAGTMSIDTSGGKHAYTFDYEFES